MKRQPIYASDYNQSRFVKWQDIGEAGSTKSVTIKDVTEETLTNEQQQEETKPCVWFNEFDKGLVLNATNRNTLSEAYGNNLLNGIGQSVVLVSSEADFRGKMVGCIRVRIPKNKPAAKKRK